MSIRLPGRGQEVKAPLLHPQQAQANPVPHSQPEQLALFAGEKTSNKRSGIFTHLMAAAAMFLPASIPLAMPAVASAQQPAQTQMYTDQKPDGQGISSVNNAEDLDYLIEQLRSSNTNIVQPFKRPLVNQQTLDTVNQLAKRLDERELGHIKVVILPSSNTGNKLGNLAEAIQSKLRLNRNNVILLNAAALRGEGSGTRVSIRNTQNMLEAMEMSVSGFDKASGDIINRHFKPNAQRGDFDAAVRETVEALNKLVETNVKTQINGAPADGPAPAPAPHNNPTISAETTRTVFAVLVFLGVLVAGGVAAGTVYDNWQKKKRSLEEVVDSVKGTLNDIGSGYEVNRGNLFSYNTLQALLQPTGKVNASELQQTFTTVEEGYVGKFDSLTGARETLKPLYLELGVNHPDPLMQLFFIRRFQKIFGTQTQDAKDNFYNLLKTTKDNAVADALIPALLESANVSDRATYAKDLDSPILGLRKLSIGTIIKNGSLDLPTAAKFWERLGTEPEAGIRKQLADALEANPQSISADALTASLSSDKADQKKLAISLLSKQGQFETLLTAGAKDTDASLQGAYQYALEDAIPPSDAAIAAILKSLETDGAGKTLALGLLTAPSKGDNKVRAFQSHLKEGTTQAAVLTTLFNSLTEGTDIDKTTSAIGNLSTHSPGTRKVLLGQLGSLNIEARRTAAATLENKLEANDIPTVLAALDSEPRPEISRLLESGLQKVATGDAAFAKLSKLLADKDVSATSKAVIVPLLKESGSAAYVPLFEALKTDGGSGSRLHSVLEQALQTIASLSVDNAKTMATYIKAKGKKDVAHNTAVQILSTEVKNWQTSKNYDTTDVMPLLREWKDHENTSLSSASTITHDHLVAAKVTAVEAEAQERYSATRIDALTKLKGAAPEKTIQDAADKAIEALNAKKPKKSGSSGRSYGSPSPYTPPSSSRRRTYDPPSYDPPSYDPPSYRPSYSPPSYDPPSYDPPSYDPPSYDPPSYDPPSGGGSDW